MPTKLDETGDRRKQILELLNEQGRTIEEVYTFFSNVPHNVIERDIRYLIRNKLYQPYNIILSRKIENDNSRSGEKTDTNSETEGNVENTEKEDNLTRQGRRPTRRKKKKSPFDAKTRREKVLQRLKNTLKTQEQIASELGVSKGVISTDIQFFIISGIITPEEHKTRKKQIKQLAKHKKSPQIEQRRKQILELIHSTNMTYEQIGKEIGVSQAKVSAEIKYLVSIGMVTQATLEDRKKQREERQREERQRKVTRKRKKESKRLRLKRIRIEQVLYLIKNKHMVESEVAVLLGASTATICKDVKYLVEKGLLEKEEILESSNKRIQIRRARIIELIRSGKLPRVFRTDIAEELGAGVATISVDVKVLMEQGLIEQDENGELRVVESKIAESGILLDNIYFVQQEHNGNSESMSSEEKKCLLILLRQIRKLSLEGNSDKAIRNLEMVKGMFSFSGDELKQLEEIESLLRREKGKKQQKDGIERKEVSDGEIGDR